MIPEAGIALLVLAIVWFGVGKGIAPLARLSDEIKARSPRDLHAIDDAQAPTEVKPIVAGLNNLFEQMTHSTRNQQRFIANAAHQLRTPIAALQAHAELAMRHPVTPEVRAELTQVLQATLRTANLAKQLLALSRAEPGGHAVDTATLVDLKRIAEALADEGVHRALEKNIDLGFELDAARTLGDPVLLREAAANLIDNAVEYVPQHGHITMRTGVEGAHAFLEVEDDGPGIPPAERERVLERFYRVPGTLGEGSGLGLAIVREIVQLHQGELLVADGAGGRGCRVRISVAAAPAQSAMAATLGRAGPQ